MNPRVTLEVTAAEADLIREALLAFADEPDVTEDDAEALANLHEYVGDQRRAALDAEARA